MMSLSTISSWLKGLWIGRTWFFLVFFVLFLTASVSLAHLIINRELRAATRRLITQAAGASRISE